MTVNKQLYQSQYKFILALVIHILMAPRYLYNNRLTYYVVT